MAAALIYSLSKIFSNGTAASKETAKASSSKSKSRSTSSNQIQKKSSLAKAQRLTEIEEQGNVTHRISRARNRVPKDDRHRYPLFLSSSHHRNGSTSKECSVSPTRDRVYTGSSTDHLLGNSSTDFVIDKSPSHNPFLEGYKSSASRSISRDRDPSRIRRHIMWEDSGYDSPSIKTDNLNRQNSNGSIRSSRADTRHKIAATHTHSPLLRTRAKSHGIDLNINVNQIRSSLRSQQSPPQHDSASSKLYGGRSRSEGRLRGMSPSFTSTPIKSERTESTTAVYQLFSETESHHKLVDSHPDTLLLNSASTFQQINRRASLLNSTVDSDDYDCALGLSSSSTEMKDMFDESMSRILEDGTSEFDGKYARWIQQVFQLQLSKMQSRLNQTFTTKLEKVIRAKEDHFMDVQQRYRDKLLDFETATEKFQEWIDTLTLENVRLKETKDAVISELKWEVTNQQRSFSLDIERQANELEAEAEKEKLKLQRRHADQLRAVSDKCMDQVAKLEDQFKHQVDSLQKLVTELKAQVESLESELVHQKNATCVHHVEDCARHNSNFERERSLRLIAELQRKLAESEREKSIIVAAHNEEIMELQTATEARKIYMNKQVIKSQTQLQEMELEHEDDMAEMTERLHKQEKANQRAIDELRRTYGSKISELETMVEELRRKQMYS